MTFLTRYYLYTTGRGCRKPKSLSTWGPFKNFTDFKFESQFTVFMHILSSQLAHESVKEKIGVGQYQPPKHRPVLCLGHFHVWCPDNIWLSKT